MALPAARALPPPLLALLAVLLASAGVRPARSLAPPPAARLLLSRPAGGGGAAMAAAMTAAMAASPADGGGGDHRRPSTVVVAGAGIVGISTAYYLARDHGIRCVVVDPTGGIAPAASGRAGGFLALDWNDHLPPLGRLARRSFALHAGLAGEGGLEGGAGALMYRRLTCAAVAVGPGRAGSRRPAGRKLEGVEWADDVPEGGGEGGSGPGVLGVQSLGGEDTIAQVHPRMLCEALWAAAVDLAGSELRRGEVVGPVRADDDDGSGGGAGGGGLVGARLADGSTVRADALLYATGPWTRQGNGAISGVKYHSVVVPTPRVLTQSVFFSGCGDPEVYPRPDGTAYCCGFPDPPVRPVTERPGEEEVRPEAVRRIVDAVREASGGTAGTLGAEPDLAQACYLPSTPDGLPLMGAMGGGDGGGGCYVAAGHSCWGILLGPGTGEAMAELIATGNGRTEHVDLGPFDPARFG